MQAVPRGQAIRGFRRTGPLAGVILLLLPTAVQAGPAPGVGRPVMLFRASFEGTTDAMAADGAAIAARAPESPSPGSATQESAGSSAFGPGRVGQGLICRDGFRLAYPTAGHIHLDQGTVELWVRPEDWHASNEQRHHVFFEMVSARCWMVLYRYYEPGRGLFFLVNDNVKKNWQIAETPIDWQPGQWHHVAIGWSRPAGVIRLHIDGRLARELRFPVLPLPTELPGTFSIGDGAWGSGLGRSTTIDEVIVWDRLLSPARVALHARGDRQSQPALTADAVFLRTEAEADGTRWRYELHLLEAGPAPETLRASLTVLPPEGATPVWRQEISGGVFPGPTAGLIDLTGQAPGAYRLTGTLHQGDTSVAQFQHTLWKLDPVWRRHRIDTDRVLPPWTPVQAAQAGDKVVGRCWNRLYHYEGGVLPAGITSGGRPLLAAPMELQAIYRDGRAVAWRRAAPSAVTARAHAAAFQIEALADGLACRAAVRIEFDGVILTDLAIQGERVSDLDALRIVVPLRPEEARYVHRVDPARGGVNVALEGRSGLADHGPFNPYLWIGGEDRGLAFFADTNRAWPNSRRPDAFEVVRQSDRVVLRLNLLSPGQVLPEPWAMRFGLLATPVKPLPDDWRRGRIQMAEKPSIWVIWPNPQQWKMFGHPDFKDPAAMRQAIADSWQRGIRPIQYTTLHQLSSAAPEWEVYGRQWALVGGWNDTFCEMNLQTPFMAVCAGTGWRDFWTWRLAQAIREYDYGGLYFDNCFISPCGNARHGHGHWIDGVYDYQIEALRDMYRRLYAAVKDQHTDGAVVHHMSGQLNLFLQAYADYALDGEHLAGRVQKADGHYTQVLSREEIRGEYMGRAAGVAPLLLPEMPGSIGYDPVKGPARTREMMALLLLHDIHLWAAYCHYETVTAIQAVMDRFGWLKRADFRAYFDADCPVRATGEEVLASVYARPEDRAAVAVVANLRRENVLTRLTVDTERLGLPADAVARDAETGQALGPARSVDLTVRALDLRLVYLASPAAPALWPAPSERGEPAVDRTERVPHGGFEQIVTFDPQAGGWPREAVARGWQIGREIPAGWTPHPASPPGVLEAARDGQARTGRGALCLGESCFVAGPTLRVQPGQVYQMEFWARGAGRAFLTGTKYGLRDGKGVFLRTDVLLPADLTPQWQHYIGVFRPTTDVDSVAVLLQASVRGGRVYFDDVSIRQVSPLEGRVIDTFGLLRQSGRYVEPGAPLGPDRLAKAQADLAAGLEELAAALKANPDLQGERLLDAIRSAASQQEPSRKDEPASLGWQVNRLHGLAQVARETAGGLRFVDVRSHAPSRR